MITSKSATKKRFHHSTSFELPLTGSPGPVVAHDAHAGSLRGSSARYRDLTADSGLAATRRFR